LPGSKRRFKGRGRPHSKRNKSRWGIKKKRCLAKITLAVKEGQTAAKKNCQGKEGVEIVGRVNKTSGKKRSFKLVGNKEKP